MGFSLGKYRTGVSAESNGRNNAVKMHQCQLYRQVVLQVDRTWRALCIHWLVRLGGEFNFELVINSNVKAAPCEDGIVFDKNFLNIGLVLIA